MLRQPPKNESRVASSNPFQCMAAREPELSLFRHTAFQSHPAALDQLPQRAPDDLSQLRGITGRTHYQPVRVRGPLQDAEKHRRVLIFGQRPVLSVFGNSHDLDARSIRHLVITAECSYLPSQRFCAQTADHYANRWRVLVVMPRERPAGKQRAALRVKVFRRYVVHVGTRRDIRRSVVPSVNISEAFVSLKSSASVTPTDSTPGIAATARAQQPSMKSLLRNCENV
jgi:hypothetical protein